MSRLTGISVDEIKKYPLRIAREFSDKYGVAVLLKGARTVIASPCGATYINTSGCAALAKAGSGDVLAGVIAGIAAQKAAAQKAESQIAASSAYSLTVTAFAEAAAQNAITQIAATQKVTSQNATSQNSASSANILTITALAETTALAAFIHGRAGEHAAKELSVYGVNAGDVIDALKHPLRRICLRYR
jgi:NAD(P)H-hydrate repair Nnr-like enzyme with NAD(P)H-hydrate dehydratase domain